MEFEQTLQQAVISQHTLERNCAEFRKRMVQDTVGMRGEFVAGRVVSFTCAGRFS